ncbi:DEKNAAC101040 [Brettanomyces naardenensis]|uniref:DEKNAAC101040 n=1 Tax=Brettanomyces naardenensis TaxID=13370 RepID=A0A448YGV6_BRENA|nr:DEKNAAC101040 [Brettanomyces naardenensis]
MLQIKYPSLLNLTNFIASDNYEASLSSTEITIEGLSKLANLLNKPLDSDNPIYSSSSYPSKVDLYLTIAAYCKRIILHPDLSQFNFTLKDIFRIWEIRLNFLLMSSGMADSKGIKPIPDAKYVRSEVEILIKEMEKIEGGGDLSSWDFRILLNRIRYGSGLQLLTFYFNEVFEARKELGEDGGKTARYKLRILLFGISSLLTARQQYLALFNQLEQVETDESRLQSELALLTALSGILLLYKDSNNVDREHNGYFDEIKEAYDKSLVDPYCHDTLVEILRTLTPVHNGQESKPLPLEEGFHFEGIDQVIELVRDLKITGRIICSLWGRFELDSKVASSAEGIMGIIHEEWRGHLNKMYGFE